MSPCKSHLIRPHEFGSVFGVPMQTLANNSCHSLAGSQASGVQVALDRLPFAGLAAPCHHALYAVTAIGPPPRPSPTRLPFLHCPTARRQPERDRDREMEGERERECEEETERNRGRKKENEEVDSDRIISVVCCLRSHIRENLHTEAAV